MKFRAWDKERKVWVPYRFQSLHNINEVQIEFFDTIQGVWYSNNDIPDNWVLTQSTGLRDKHNHEIFEGDTLKYVNEWQNIRSEIIGTVVIEKSTAILRGIKYLYINGEEIDNGKPEVTMLLYYLESDKAEIFK